jgi:hypothetical protein
MFFFSVGKNGEGFPTHARNLYRGSLGTTLMNQNSIHAEIESRLYSGNACYHSVQNLVFQFTIQKRRY